MRISDWSSTCALPICAGQGARNDKMAYDKSAHEELLARIAKLNTTERDCLLRVNEGKASKDIARELGLSPNYVDTCLKQAAVKLNVKGRYLAAKILAEDRKSTRLNSSH